MGRVPMNCMVGRVSHLTLGRSRTEPPGSDQRFHRIMRMGSPLLLGSPLLFPDQGAVRNQVLVIFETSLVHQQSLQGIHGHDSRRMAPAIPPEGVRNPKRWIGMLKTGFPGGGLDAARRRNDQGLARKRLTSTQCMKDSNQRLLVRSG